MQPFFGSPLVKSKPAWLRPEELKFEAKKIKKKEEEKKKGTSFT